MGVSLSQYRACIGAFLNFGQLKFRQKILNSTKNSASSKMFVFFLICFLLFNSLVTEPHQKNCFYSFRNISNHSSKCVNGNGKNQGIRISHFNKGGSYLGNRVHEIENVINNHHPHILGISEANFFKDHDVDEVQIENYSLVTAKTIDNSSLNVSRVCVYLHNSIVAKIRFDLMNDTFSSIWIEAGLPNKRKILIGNVYREWGYLRQNDYHESRDLNAQMNRWVSFVDQWERALDEGKEVVVLGDFNINHIDWTKDDALISSQTKKLRPLIDKLLERIYNCNS